MKTIKLVLYLVLFGLIVFGAYSAFSGGMNLFSPEPKVTINNGTTVIEAIRRQAKLSTMNMYLSKNIDIEKEKGFLGLCTEKVTYFASFNIQAGIDLQQIKEDKLQVENDGNLDSAVVEIQLPDPEILSVELDTQNSRILEQDGPVFVPGCSHDMANMTLEAQQMLKESVTKDALEKGILSQAQQQASEELGRLLTDVGYTNITIRASNGSVLYSTKPQ
ncbi:DUF4230 domain-containing protein [Herpetosiphon llansteffanensis]|uniref:DUF4230 domain-containing protein n=1 Tax=Herpetosiphon llansteffanensis TaxID=2094568 RepID=UPI000D7CC32B|nr:DUF4230 domain-containing protein [Herpetosiphon llansteffanensis]